MQTMVRGQQIQIDPQLISAAIGVHVLPMRSEDSRYRGQQIQIDPQLICLQVMKDISDSEPRSRIPDPLGIQTLMNSNA
jgi:hypothetical protein